MVRGYTSSGLAIWVRLRLNTLPSPLKLFGLADRHDPTIPFERIARKRRSVALTGVVGIDTKSISTIALPLLFGKISRLFPQLPLARNAFLSSNFFGSTNQDEGLCLFLFQRRKSAYDSHAQPRGSCANEKKNCKSRHHVLLNRPRWRGLRGKCQGGMQP
jgi:hypothetical protein